MQFNSKYSTMQKNILTNILHKIQLSSLYIIMFLFLISLSEHLKLQHYSFLMSGTILVISINTNNINSQNIIFHCIPRYHPYVQTSEVYTAKNMF